MRGRKKRLKRAEKCYTLQRCRLVDRQASQIGNEGLYPWKSGRYRFSDTEEGNPPTGGRQGKGKEKESQKTKRKLSRVLLSWSVPCKEAHALRGEQREKK